MNDNDTPLAVDLDGTLIFSDMLFESLVRLLKKNMFYIFMLPIWLLQGKAFLKQAIAERVTIDVTTLPYNDELVDHLKLENAKGRPLYLVTASNKLIAQPICDHLGFFTGLYASDEQSNLKGKTKAELLNKVFGTKNYCYAGNDSSDLIVWQSAKSGILVSNNNALIESAKKSTAIEHEFTPPKASLKTALKAIRVHQWVKNSLLFVPIFAAHKFTDVPLLLDVLLAAIAFSFCASSVYLLNDLMDIEADRHHKTKKNRPFASGHLPIQFGLVGFPILFGVALLLSLNLPLPFTISLIVYYIATSAYSFALKQKLLIDVVVLAGLFTARIIAGAAASSVLLSEWLLAFSMFFFLSLAMVKRYTELVYLNESGQTSTKGRGYRVTDIPIVASMGIASGYISVLVFALYLNSQAVTGLYAHPTLLWLLGPILLYWISRLWMLAQRGQMHDDPIVFAIRDRVSQIMGLIIAVTFLAAQ